MRSTRSSSRSDSSVGCAATPDRSSLPPPSPKFPRTLRKSPRALRGSDVTLRQLKEEDMRLPDQSDWASAEIQRSFELRTRDRERKLLSKIEAALKRIEDGSYGYCEETQEPIGIRRLEARPIATLSIEAQERHERRERAYRED